MGRENPPSPALTLEDDRPRPVGKKDTCIPIGPISDGGESFGPDQENGPIRAGPDKAIRHRQTINEP